MDSLKPPSSGQATPRALFPSAGSAQRVGGSRGRTKVALDPGHSPLDWANLRNSGHNLRGVDVPHLIKVTREELARHASPDDAWTMLGGKVYNITPYVPFHPGGKAKVLLCAGKDGTRLFQANHAWVNYEHMLDKCLVGFYVG